MSERQSRTRSDIISTFHERVTARNQKDSLHVPSLPQVGKDILIRKTDNGGNLLGYASKNPDVTRYGEEFTALYTPVINPKDVVSAYAVLQAGRVVSQLAVELSGIQQETRVGSAIAKKTKPDPEATKILLEETFALVSDPETVQAVADERPGDTVMGNLVYDMSIHFKRTHDEDTYDPPYSPHPLSHNN